MAVRAETGNPAAATGFWPCAPAARAKRMRPVRAVCFSLSAGIWFTMRRRGCADCRNPERSRRCDASLMGKNRLTESAGRQREGSGWKAWLPGRKMRGKMRRHPCVWILPPSGKLRSRAFLRRRLRQRNWNWWKASCPAIRLSFPRRQESICWKSCCRRSASAWRYPRKGRSGPWRSLRTWRRSLPTATGRRLSVRLTGKSRRRKKPMWYGAECIRNISRRLLQSTGRIRSACTGTESIILLPPTMRITTIRSTCAVPIRWKGFWRQRKSFSWIRRLIRVSAGCCGRRNSMRWTGSCMCSMQRHPVNSIMKNPGCGSCGKAAIRSAGRTGRHRSWWWRKTVHRCVKRAKWYPSIWLPFPMKAKHMSCGPSGSSCR